MSELNQAPVVQVPLDQIFVDPERVRQEFSEAQMKELEFSIRAHDGLIHPIIVERIEDPDGVRRYRLVAGERRLRAHKRLHRPAIACRILSQLPEDERLALELEENLRRHNITWQERAKGLKDLYEIRARMAALHPQPNAPRTYTQQQLATELGMSASTVSRDIDLASHFTGNPDIHKAVSRSQALDILRATKRNETVIDKYSAELYHFEKHFFPDLSAAARRKANLVILDLTHKGPDELLLDASKNFLAPNGQCVCIFEPHCLTPVLAYLACPPRPTTITIGTDRFYMVLWYSNKLRRPTGRMEPSYAYRQSPGPFEYSKPMAFYNMLLAAFTARRDTVMHLNALDLSCARVCLEADREIMIVQDNPQLWDKLILHAKEPPVET